MGKQNLGGIYANMDFPPYEWKEYPKHVPTGNGRYAVALNESEEKSILARLQQDEDEAPAIVAPYVADPAKEILISRARELQVPFNSKWSKAKLQKLVEEAEKTIDNLPVENPNDLSEEELSLSTEELKDKLIAEAKSLGIPANKLWGIPRLKSSIADAKGE